MLRSVSSEVSFTCRQAGASTLRDRGDPDAALFGLSVLQSDIATTCLVFQLRFQNALMRNWKKPQARNALKGLAKRGSRFMRKQLKQLPRLAKTD